MEAGAGYGAGGVTWVALQLQKELCSGLELMSLSWTDSDSSTSPAPEEDTSVIILQRNLSVPRVRDVLFPLKRSDWIPAASPAPNTRVTLGSGLTLLT